MKITTAKEWHAEARVCGEESQNCIPGEEGYYLGMAVVAARAAQAREALDLMARVKACDHEEWRGAEWTPDAAIAKLSTDAAFGFDSVIRYGPGFETAERLARVL